MQTFPGEAKRTRLRCFPVTTKEPQGYCHDCPTLGSCSCVRQNPNSRKFEVTDFDTGKSLGCCVANSIVSFIMESFLLRFNQNNFSSDPRRNSSH